jgi:hypothetical protein
METILEQEVTSFESKLQESTFSLSLSLGFSGLKGNENGRNGSFVSLNAPMWSCTIAEVSKFHLHANCHRSISPTLINC